MSWYYMCVSFFFFQAEDGIRDLTVTGVQTCALPISFVFPTAQVEYKGKHPVFGPSSVTLGDGVVYVGNRGNSTVCVIDAHALKIGECLAIGSPAEGLSAAPDALTYVAAVRELWVTRGVPPMEVPSSDRAITVLDASEPTRLRLKGKIALGASAEGFAVDNQRGRFYTSLQERGETVSIDIHRHEIVARWHSGCDEPHGLALDAARGILFVACTARVVTMRSEEHTSELQSQSNLVCRLLLEKNNN